MPMMPMETARDAGRPASLQYLNDALPAKPCDMAMRQAP